MLIAGATTRELPKRPTKHHVYNIESSQWELPLAPEKDKKKVAVKAAFESLLINGTDEGFTLSNGWAVYDSKEDLNNYRDALDSLLLTDTASKIIRIKTGLVTATQDDLRLLIKELLIYGEGLFAKKWQLEQDIASAETIEQLNLINW